VAWASSTRQHTAKLLELKSAVLCWTQIAIATRHYQSESGAAMSDRAVELAWFLNASTSQ